MIRFILLLLVVGVAHAQKVVKINDTTDEHVFMPYELWYFTDTTNAISFQEISSNPFESRFKQHGSYQNIDFQVNVSYWIRLPIQLHSNKNNVWLLEFYDQTIDSLESFIPRSDGTYSHVRMGDHHPFSDRFIRHKNFEILLNVNSSLPYYFKVRSHEFADVRIAIRSVDRFIFYALNEYYLYGMFYGMILIIAVYNFLVYLAIREIKFIYYICYILSVALYAMSYDGIGFQYVWPNHPKVNNWAVGTSLYLLIFWALVFTRRFLNTRTHAPTLDKALKTMIILRTIWFAFSLLIYPKMLSFRTLEIIPLSLIFYTAIAVWQGGYRPARFFVVAYGVLFFGFFIRTLVYYNWLPITTITHYSLHFSFVFEMLFLTVALGDRIRILKNNRDRAMQRILQQNQTNIQLKEKMNRELEEKVKERTQELDQKNKALLESNEKLNQQSTEINQINSMLDLDNWKLKNRVKEVLEERMHERLMDYKEFVTLYPDDMACYRFLETQKEKIGFECAKCSGTKFSNGSQKFSRRCTRCGYNESITANTLFHGVKFPLAKAFYLSYLTQSGKNGYTLESLSNSLDLRLNTVWTFKKKVQERINLDKRHLNSWEEIILNAPEIKVNKSSKK